MLAPQEILDALGLAVAVYDANATVVSANDRVHDLLGVPRGSLIGRPRVGETCDLHDLAGNPVGPDRRIVALALRTGMPQRAVLDVALSEGRRRWLEVTAAPHRGSDGAVTHAVVTATDVTDDREALRRAEEALAESERLYHSVLRAMSEGVVVHDHRGDIRFTNPAAERLLGMTAEQLRGVTPRETTAPILDAEGQPFDPTQFPSEVTLRTGRPCRNVVMSACRPDGQQVWLSVASDPVSADPVTGKATSVVVTMTDITEERAARALLARSQAHFQQVIDAVPGVIYEVRGRGTDLRLTFVSKRVEELLGLSLQAALGDLSAVFSRFHPQELAILLGAIQQLPHSLVPATHEFRVLSGNNEWRWCRTHSVPVVEGDEIVWHGVLLDVTEERRLGEALRHQQRVDAMGRLAAGVAHNFNNILGAILPNLELATAASQGEVRDMLEDARRATLGASELVRQLLRLTRKEAESATGPVDLTEVVRELVALLQRTIDRSVKLDVQLPDGPVWVAARANDLNQVLLNLCLNARDAMEGSTFPTLSLSVEQLASKPVPTTGLDAGQVVVRLRDNGVGMDEDTQRLLGEPFFTTKAPGEGTGLGLASVFGTVRELGGLVEVSSAIGQGTTVTLRLPSHPGPPPTQRALPPPTTRLDGKTLLVVDDEPLVRKALLRQLVRLGAKVTEAADGPGGVAAFEAGRFDLVLLDMNLPGLSGDRVLQAIHRADPEQPVVVLTGHVEALPGLAASAVLTKPVSGELLAQVVLRHVRTRT